MIRVILEIKNKACHSCSPIEFVRKFILSETKVINPKAMIFPTEFENPYAKIYIRKIEQI